MTFVAFNFTLPPLTFISHSVCHRLQTRDDELLVMRGDSKGGKKKKKKKEEGGTKEKNVIAPYELN